MAKRKSPRSMAWMAISVAISALLTASYPIPIMIALFTLACCTFLISLAEGIKEHIDLNT